MKIRTDFVTNSSSSSFIITNKTNEKITGEMIAKKLENEFYEFKKECFSMRNDNSTFEDMIASAINENITVDANSTEIIECGDHRDDGLFEMFIHYIIYDSLEKDDFEIEFYESHH